MVRALWRGALLSLALLSSLGARAETLLVRFRSGITSARIEAVVRSSGAQDGVLAHTGVHRLRLPGKGALRAFRASREVEWAEEDRYCRPAGGPNDPYYPQEWHLPKISAPGAWSVSTGSASIVIAIIDTGVDSTHPDLAPKMVAGWNLWDDTADTNDVYGHGTAVAGAAAAISNNGTGVASVAWNCKIMPVRVSDTSGGAYISTIANGLTWAADHGARVANISYGVSESAAVATSAQYFQSKGGVVTVAAGNSSLVSVMPDCPYLLTVSASDQNDTVPSWSNTGANISVAAPGVSIYSTSMGGGYGSYSGTSLSAPLVAGVAALVLSVNPGLSGPDARAIVEQSADDLGAPGWDPSYGYGRVNAARAVSLAGGTPTPDVTAPVTSIDSVSVGRNTLTARASASDDVGVVSVELWADGARVGTVTTAPYVFTLNVKRWSRGSHSLQTRAVDAAGNVGWSAVVSIRL